MKTHFYLCLELEESVFNDRDERGGGEGVMRKKLTKIKCNFHV